MIAIAKTRNPDTFVLTAIAAVLSAASFLHFYSQDKVLLYGDAVAHINIARRVFDSQFPGLSQLGTVWLPLPHLLMLPFIVNDKLWSTGIGGSIVSMLAYVAGAIGIARIFWASGAFSSDEAHDHTLSRVCGWVAALVYLLNPNLLYLQSTAMTEPLGLALMIWAIYFCCRFTAEQRKALFESIDEQTAAAHGRAAESALLRCGVILAAAMLTRYDYWFLAGVLAFAVVLQFYFRYRGLALVQYKRQIQQRFRKKLIAFVVLLAIVPAFWLAYNQVLFGNAMEFANGKYSARAIAERSLQQGNAAHPGAADVRVAATYYWKTARLNIGENHAATIVVTGAALGIIALAFSEFSLALLLIFPLIFYTFSIAYGGIPIFIPQWWPFSYYNVRYGIQMLPAVAIGCGCAVHFADKIWSTHKLHSVAAGLLMGMMVASYGPDWARGPICLREAEVNSAGRIELQKAVAQKLKTLPFNATFVVSLTEHVGVFQRAGIPLRRTWNESSHRKGEKEFDFPLSRGDYALAFAGDQVMQMVAQHPESVDVVAVFPVIGEKLGILYKTGSKRKTLIVE